MQKLHVLAFALYLIALLSPLGAQTTAGSIVGTVTDPSGAVVAGIVATVIMLGMCGMRVQFI